MNQILVGILGIPLGIIMLKYNKQVKDFVGDISWAEKHIGSGGTYFFLKMISLLISILSFLYMTGTLQGWLGSFFAPIT